jgi:hypothetical protein
LYVFVDPTLFIMISDRNSFIFRFADNLKSKPYNPEQPGEAERFVSPRTNRALPRHLVKGLTPQADGLS